MEHLLGENGPPPGVGDRLTSPISNTPIERFCVAATFSEAPRIKLQLRRPLFALQKWILFSGKNGHVTDVQLNPTVHCGLFEVNIKRLIKPNTSSNKLSIKSYKLHSSHRSASQPATHLWARSQWLGGYWTQQRQKEPSPKSLYTIGHEQHHANEWKQDGATRFDDLPIWVWEEGLDWLKFC